MPPFFGSRLADLIRREISRDGVISFARYMELALYQPELGYYRRGQDPFGAGGDYFTAEQLQPFAELLRSFIEQNSSTLQRSTGGRVLELGAGRGDLREGLDGLEYRGIEWGQSELPAKFSGFVIANEFFDALPVHLVRKRQEGWRELGVGSAGHTFHFTEQAMQPAFAGYVQRYGSDIPLEGLLEIPSQLGIWIARIADFLCEGLFIVLDYGYSDRELARFPQGTLMSYRRHVATHDVLSDPGERDITSHVNFTELIRVAEAHGFRVQSDCSLQKWALSMWNEEEMGMRLRTSSWRWRMEWKQLVFGMGETFRVVVLRREAGGTAPKTNAPEISGAKIVN